ncbi:predicted protein [Phaeodactylum tricornutum CCAP 1055/1]|jgi:tRNA (guanine-N7-)-methyltransferase|uniref:tRNA (guanine-N(7)-)-methyltransferase n=2 Tax=Phaeodactylum tricornutum TaxID=2850 RepID=B5Y3J6_PHATC|nr:predicted protein [Phaeodactylum tricornutum CCAP 1055/1]ACI65140.1 predicted protein [Phaeodactylum tricornutum CCAP 1055/1]|eukprot:XP_002185670.1 predicted protein [Phaeodactylum tricornutum CCAP 1055/1]
MTTETRVATIATESKGKDGTKRKAAPITLDGEKPQKKFYRQRAHCNPLSHNDSFDYPVKPLDIDWTEDHFPGLEKGSVPTVLDIGCGFGGLTMALAPLLPSQIVLGMEIRAKVTEYVRLRIVAARKEQEGRYKNASVLRTNSMKFLPNFFGRSSLEKLFFCFPDPHFKRKNHPRRIVSERLLSEYAYVLKPSVGRLYCITDVKELHEWHVEKCERHPLFRRVEDEIAEIDPCVQAMKIETEESKKVARAGGEKYYAVFERISIDQATEITSTNFFH